MAAAQTQLVAIPDGGACTLEQPTTDGTRSIIVLRRGTAVWGYVNRCPHFSLPLDFEPGEFATYDGQVLMCAHHSALFRFEDGVCIDGPCAGHRLDPVDLEIANGVVRVV